MPEPAVETREATALTLLGALRVPFGTYVPVAIAGLAFAAWAGIGPLRIAVLGVTGFLLWTLDEYLLHRFVLHQLPRGALRRFVGGRHLLHHRDPERHPGIALLWVSASVAIAGYGAFALVLGPAVAAAILSGVIAGYLTYEYLHLAAHAGPPPRTRLGARLRSHHVAHHHGNAGRNFAIVLPVWDRAFRTMLAARPRLPPVEEQLHRAQP